MADAKSVAKSPPALKSQTIPLASITVSWEYHNRTITIDGKALGAVLAWLAIEHKRYGDEPTEGVRVTPGPEPRSGLNISPRVLAAFTKPPTYVMRGLADAVTRLGEVNDSTDDDAIVAVGSALRDLIARIEATDEWHQTNIERAVVTIRPKGGA